MEREEKLKDAINKKIDNVDDKSEKHYKEILKNFELYENSIRE